MSDLDVVVFGATGFVGRLTVEYLARTAPAGVRIGLAGRSRERLEQVRAGSGRTGSGRTEWEQRAQDWPLLVVDAGQPAALAAAARVVVSTVGPYARHGLPLVQACAAAGTHYADLTGEVTFVRDSIDSAHETARRTGARIVHACGFDSVPSDLAALLLAERARADGAGTLTDTTLVLVSASGGVSGGTVASLRGMVEEAVRSPERRRLLVDPYALSPDRNAEPDLGRQLDTGGVRRRDGRWTAPFVMAPYNARIVRRSNALTDWSYGRGLRYREVLGVGRGPAGPLLGAAVAAGTVGATAGLVAAAVLPWGGAVLDRLLPAPGTGPSAGARERGHFRTETTATTSGGARYRAAVAATGDPGYAATSVMLGQAALALALDGSALPDAAGVLTPATGIGGALVDRLRGEGFTLAVEPA